MTRPAQLVLGLLLAVVIAAPVAAVTPGGASQRTLTGTLEQAYVDGFGTTPDSTAWTLRSGNRLTHVNLRGQDAARYEGRRVSITGNVAAETLDAASITTADAGTTPAAPEPALPATDVAAPVAKSIAVVMFNFTDLRTTPYSAATLQNALTGPGGVKAFYEEESKGAVSITASVYGWYQIDAATTGCAWSTWHTLAWNAAVADGVNLASFTNVMFVFPNTPACGFAGLGYVPGSYTYINGTTSVQVLTHELGHNMGVSHSNAYNCTVNGTRVAIAAVASCTVQTYADPFSTMGNNALRHNHASHLGELGWLTADQKAIGSPGNTYTLAPYFGAGPTKLVRIPRGDGTFFDLDIRSPYGSFDTYSAGSPAVAGVTIRVGQGTASPTWSPKMTLLVDTTPGTSSLTDAPLLVGRSLTDPVSTITITALSVDASGISVRVTEGIDPTAPANLSGNGVLGTGVTLAWAAATDNVALDGYRVARDGVVVAALPANATAYTDAAAQSGHTYAYTVTAIDTSGNLGPAAGATVVMPVDPSATPTPPPDPNATPAPTQSPPVGSSLDTYAPSTPGDIAAEVGITTVRLTWSASTDDIGVVAYRVTREGALVGTTSADTLTWTDTGRAPLSVYGYAVEALDAVGNPSIATSITVQTNPDTVRPSTPTGLRRAARSGTYVTFDWADTPDNVRTVKYYIYRVGRSTPIAMTRISQVRIATVSGAYYYVRAVDAAGNRSANSARLLGRS